MFFLCNFNYYYLIMPHKNSYCFNIIISSTDILIYKLRTLMYTVMYIKWNNYMEKKNIFYKSNTYKRKWLILWTCIIFNVKFEFIFKSTEDFLEKNTLTQQKCDIPLMSNESNFSEKKIYIEIAVEKYLPFNAGCVYVWVKERLWLWSNALLRSEYYTQTLFSAQSNTHWTYSTNYIIFNKYITTLYGPAVV